MGGISSPRRGTRRGCANDADSSWCFRFRLRISSTHAVTSGIAEAPRHSMMSQISFQRNQNIGSMSLASWFLFRSDISRIPVVV